MTASAWCPSATRVPLGQGLDGCGPMLGGPPRAVHHTTEGDTLEGAEATYRKTGCYPHLTVDYARDVVHQHIPVTAGATALKNASGGVQTNRHGTVCIQIEWVGHAAQPFTARRGSAGPNVRALFDWIRTHQIPNVWPEGPPPPYGQSGAPAYGAGNGERHAQTWTEQAGHYGHSQVPENTHGDPGAIDSAFVTQSTVKAPAWWTHETKLGDRDQEVASACKILGIPLRVTFDRDLHDRVCYIQRKRGHAVTGRIDASTASLIQAWPS